MLESLPITDRTPSAAPAVRSRRSVRVAIVVAFALWVAAVSTGFALLWRYELAPGEISGAPTVWPDDVDLSRSANAATLLMFVHPQCPCSQASLNELERLVARCHGQVEARVLFVQPHGAPADWSEGPLWQAAGRIPGVEAVVDRDGAWASRFGAATSGHVVLYDATGRLAYRGGITASRGHEGDNRGRLTIEHLLLRDGPVAVNRDQPVFGCPLFDGAARNSDGARG